jgi:hypothetical protein
MNALSAASQWIVPVSLLLSGGYAAAADARPSSANPSTCPKNVELASLVAESDLIVVATPDVPVALVESAIGQQSSDYIDVPLSEASLLKGADTGRNLTLKFYPQKTTYAPPPEALVEQTDRPSLLFLTRVDQGPAGVYLTHSLDALQDASRTRVEAVEAEVRRQGVLLAQSSPDASLPHFTEIRELVSALPRATPEKQKAIFQKLEAMGQAGVPAIVASMDDRRRLAVPQITLVNHNPEAFEGLRHYGPELIVDALDAILNQITGFGGSIVNGGSERERQAAVAAWRVYAADIGCP